MRNADVINVITAKIAAHLTELTGIHITPLTAEDIERERALPFAGRTYPLGSGALYPYIAALGSEGMQRAGYSTWASSHEDSIWYAITRTETYINESLRDLDTLPAPEPGEEPQDVIEDFYLARVAAAYRPDTPDGTPADDARRLTAEADLAMAYQDTGAIRPIDRTAADTRARLHAPAGFVPASSDPQAALAEQALAGWAALHGQRDHYIRAAFNSGTTKTRIHELTGLSRVTIDRILG